jgi:dTDP-4-amino-4,6-dideoxygalactose transaminase
MPALPLPSDADSSGRTFGAEELELLRRVIDSGTLNCTKGTMVREFERRFAECWGLPFARCTTSGTAAIHTAVAAVDPEPGDEIITSPITDMGAIAPILYQGAIPVFADVEPSTYNVTAATIAPRLTSRTRAVIVTHLFGNPCAMDDIMALAAERTIPVIEDCAQAYLCQYRGRLVGTIGDIGCFSMQQGKHLSAGEGGVVVTRHEGLARRMRLFVDKAWGYGDPDPDHYFLAPNYRMTELQGAVALAQLGKVERTVARRQRTARVLGEAIAGLTGIQAPATTPGGVHVYWKFPLRVDSGWFVGGLDAVSAFLKAHGVHCAPRYVQKPAFECRVIRNRVTFGSSRWPWSARGADEPAVDRAGDYPGTMEALARVLVLPWNERYEMEHVLYIAEQLRAAVHELSKE